MEYNKGLQKTYALRTILNFKKVHEQVDYEITFITTTLLGVLTSLNPDDNNWMINTNRLDNLPYIEADMSQKDYLKSIRNALAHKTESNFIDYRNNSEIQELQLASTKGITIRLNYSDFYHIIEALEKQIISEIDIFEIFENNIHKYSRNVIPKPQTTNQYIKGIGERRGEKAIIYCIPLKNTNNHAEKGINKSELNRSFTLLYENKYFNRKVFTSELPECAKEGGCNFTTIGGLFEMLKIAKYENGKYLFKSI